MEKTQVSSKLYENEKLFLLIIETKTEINFQVELMFKFNNKCLKVSQERIMKKFMLSLPNI